MSICTLYPVCSLQSAVCILYLVCILYPVCSLQSAVCSLHFVLTVTTNREYFAWTSITNESKVCIYFLIALNNRVSDSEVYIIAIFLCTRKTGLIILCLLLRNLHKTEQTGLTTNKQFPIETMHLCFLFPRHVSHKVKYTGKFS